jgi:hypothetical protein
MDDKKRPGGLTALAVINFIFAALSFFGLIGFATMSLVTSKIPMDQMPEAQKAQFVALQNMGHPMFAILVGVTFVSLLLLLLSGIGYLKQKKVLGRTLGTIYAALAILHVIISPMIFPKELGGSFNIMSIIGLIYPALTLILINTTFKDDLVN